MFLAIIGKNGKILAIARWGENFSNISLNGSWKGMDHFQSSGAQQKVTDWLGGVFRGG